MIKNSPEKFNKRWIGVFALVFTLACSLTVPNQDTTNNEPAGGGEPPQSVADASLPQIQLAAPLEGAIYYEGVPVNVLARVENAGDDIERVEIRVDGEVVTTLPAANPAGAPVFSIAQSWTPDTLGTRQLSVVVFRNDGSSAASQTSMVQVLSTDPNAQAQPVANPSDEEQSNGGGGLIGSILGGGGGGNNSQPEQEQPQTSTSEDTDSVQQEQQEALPTSTLEPTDEPTDAPPTETATPSRPIARLTVGANVREGPGTNFIVLGAYAANTEVDALAVNPDGTWYKVQYYNAEGWIFGDLVTISNADQLPVEVGPPTPVPATATFTPVPATAVPTDTPSNVNLVFDGPVEINPYPPECNQTMAIGVRIKNEGEEGMGRTAALRVRDTHIGSGAQTEITAPIPDIPAGETRTVRDIFLTVDTNFDSEHRIEVFLDVNNEISESNEGDNATRQDALVYTLEQGSC